MWFSTLSIVIILLMSGEVLSSEPLLSKGSKEPVNVTSEILYVYPNKNHARFERNVVATQENTVLISDIMHVDYSQELKQLKKIDAEGNVQLTLPDRVVTGDRGVYDLSDGMLVVTGNVFMQKDGTELYGDVFTYDANLGESRLIGGAPPEPPQEQLLPQEMELAPTNETVLPTPKQPEDAVENESEKSLLNPLNWFRGLF